MPQVSQICSNCFNAKATTAKCEHCGWEESPQPKHALPYHTVIQGQYVVGRLLLTTPDSLVYIAYDTKLNRLVVLVECFPESTAQRGADKVTVSAKDAERFADKLADFIHLGRTRLWIEEPNIQRLANYFEENHTAYWVLSWHSGLPLTAVYANGLSENAALVKTLPIFVALKVLHERGLVLDVPLVEVALEDEFGSEVLMTIGKFADEADKRHDVRQAAALLLQLIQGKKVSFKKMEDIAPAIEKLELSSGVNKALNQALSPESYAQMHDFIEALTGEKQIPTKEVVLTRPQIQTVPGFSDKPIEVLPSATTFLHEDEIPEEYLLPKPPKKTDYRSIALATLGGIGLVGALGVWIWLSLAPKRLLVNADGSAKYKTIEAAIKEAGQDATIYVAPGTYQENLVIAKPVKLIAEKEDGEVIILGKNKPALTAFAPIGKVQGFTFKSVADKKSSTPALLVVDGGIDFEDIRVQSNSGAGLRVTGANTNPTFRGILAKDNLAEGILFDGGAKGMVENIQVSGNGSFGIHLLDGANPIFRYGKVSYNYLGGISVEAAGGTFADLEVVHHQKPNVNIAFGADPLFKRVEIAHSKQNGVYVLEQGKGTFEQCNIYQNLFAGVNVIGKSNPVLKNSKIYDGKDVGIWFHDSSGGYVEGLDVYRNAQANIRISTAAHPTIKKSIIRDGFGYGFFIDEKGRGILKEVKVYGNKLAGVNINHGANPLIKMSEIFNGLQAGIMVIDEGLGRVENSQIYGNAFQNVHVSYGAHPSFFKNRIYNGKSSGVWVEESGRGVFESDSIYANRKSGVGIRTSGSPIFKKVAIMTNQSHGVWVAFTGSGTFMQNRIANNNGYGIYVEDGTSPTIGQNKYKENKSGAVKDLRKRINPDSTQTKVNSTISQNSKIKSP